MFFAQRSESAVQYRLRRFDGQYRWFLVRAEPIFDQEGRTICWLGTCTFIDDRKQREERTAEEAVRASEAFVRSVLDALPEHVAVLDAAGIIVAVNRPWSQYASHNGGLSMTASPIGVCYLDVFQRNAALEDPYAQTAHMRLCELLNGTVDAFDLEYPCHSPHRQQWYLISGRRVMESPHVVISHLEITARKQSEERLQSSTERFRLAADAVNGIIYDVDFLTGHVERTRGLYEVVGYHPEDVPPTGAWCAEQIHPDDRARVSDVDADTFPTDTATTVYRVRHKDGRWLHVEDRAVLVRDELGKALRLVGCTTDVTERVMAIQSLKDREQFVQSVLHASPGVVYLFDVENGRTVFINQQVETALGLTPVQVIGGEDFMAAHVHPEDLPTLVAHVERVASLADGEVLSSEYRMRHVDGHWVWFSSRDVVFLRSAEGRAKQILGVASDVTAQKETADRLRDSEELHRAAFDCAPVGMVYLDLDESFVKVNPAMCEITGYSAGELLRMKVADVTHPEDRTADAESLKQYFSGM